MGKLNIPQELSDKISKSLRIKQTDLVDSGGNKPIIREPPKKDSPMKQNREPQKRDSPVKRTHESPKRDSPMKQTYKERTYEHPKQNSPKKNPVLSTKKIFYKSVKSNKPDKPDKINYIKISKIVFMSSIVGGIGIILGVKLGFILFM